MTRWRYVVGMLALAALTVVADDEWTAAHTQALVDAVRHPPIAECWAVMTGTVVHKARGHSTLKLPIELRARFSPQRSLAQLVFNSQERYLVGQNFSEGIAGTSVIEEHGPGEGKKALRDIGIRPSDITLSFLYWEYLEDRGDDRFKAQDCRILKFKHPTEAEYVLVWVSTKHGFPMQVKWFMGKEQDEKPYRQLEITGLKKVNEVWIVSEVQVSNPGWKSTIEFGSIKLETVTEDSPLPPDLFVTDPQ